MCKIPFKLSFLIFCCFLNWPGIYLFAQEPENKKEIKKEIKVAPWLEVLSNDPQLQVYLRFQIPARPTFQEVYDHLKKGTGVPLSSSDQKGTDLMFFHAATEFTAPAWKIMKRLAETQVIDGKWEKVDNGYVLHGKLKDPFLPGYKAYDEAHAKAEKSKADFAKFHPLGVDYQLQKRLTVVEKNPKLKELLKRLNSSTGLTFSLADSLSDHNPDMGSISLTNMPAYSFMELIEKHELDKGRWVKIKEGYRLEGVPSPPKKIVMKKNEPQKHWTPWYFFGLGIFLLACGALVIYRQKTIASRKSPVRPPGMGPANSGQKNPGH